MKDKTFEACLTIIEKEGWRAFTFAKASKASGIPLSKFHAKFSSPSDVMIQLFKKIDEEVLKNIDISEDSSSRDALFEIIMARLDAALPYKLIIRTFWSELIFTPEESPLFGCRGLSSIAWMLEAAGIRTRGLTGMLRIQGVLTLYLFTLRTWLSDESPDMGTTMIFLDKGINNLERVGRFFSII